MIFDAKKKVMYSLRHDDKVYLEISTAEPRTPRREAIEDIVVMKTGAKDKAAGYPCKIYRTTDQVGRQYRRSLHGERDRQRRHVRNDERAGGQCFRCYRHGCRRCSKMEGFRSKAWTSTGRGKEEARSKPPPSKRNTSMTNCFCRPQIIRSGT